MTTSKNNCSEFSSELTCRIVLKLCTAVTNSDGSVSISENEFSSSTLNETGQCESWAIRAVSMNGFGENATYADSGVENYISSTGAFSPIVSHPGCYYVVLPTSMSSSNEVLSYIATVLEKSRNFEIIIKSESSPPYN